MDTMFQVNFLQFNSSPRHRLALHRLPSCFIYLYDLSHDEAVLSVVRNTNAARY
jgi:hypothetical protein